MAGASYALWLLLVTAAASPLGLVACSASDGQFLGLGDSTPTDTNTAAPGPSEAGPTARQLRDYDQALARWSDYELESAPLWADPHPSRHTLGVFASYFVSGDFMQHRLEDYRRAGVKVTGLPAKVLWSRAARIIGSSVYIRQCVDPANVRTTQRGRSVKPSLPFVREIRLDKSPDSGFLIVVIRDPSMGVMKPCGPGVE
jgi:hypothetical protein